MYLHYDYTMMVVSLLLPLLHLLAIHVSTVTAVRRLDVNTSPNAPHHHAHHAAANNTTTTSFRTLLGKNVDVPVAESPDDHVVTDLPLLDPDDFHTTHWAGLLPASNLGDKYLFYWMFAPDPDVLKGQNLSEKDVPLLIWLNGGPACSSMDGLWLENGPFRLNNQDGNWNIQIDPYSWHKAPAYVVYIDQPVGTGIAFTTSGNYPRNDEQVNVDFYYFLEQFLHLHGDKFLQQKTDEDNQWQMSRKLFFSGESHAGHYIPSMMNHIQRQNKKPDASIIVNLGGGAIGNGWVDPIYQYSAQDVAYGYAMIGAAQQRSLAADEEKCRQKIQKGDYRSDTCFDLLDTVLANSQGKNSKYVVSQYDQRKWEIKNKPRDFPPGHRDVEAYLGGHGPNIPNFNFENVLKAIHSTPSLEAGQVYYECTDPPYNALKHQDGLGVVPDVVDLLNNGVRLLFFNGVHDLICNHVGNENAIENFPWKDRDAYQTATRYGWQAPSTQQLGGYIKEYKNLQYLKVLDSGHMVPMDVPEISLDLIRLFMYEQSFNSFQQEIGAMSQAQGQPSCPICPTCDYDDVAKDDDDSVLTASPVSCPQCEDCNQVCKTKNAASNDGGSAPDFSSMMYGAVSFLALAGVWTICCLFLRRGQRGSHQPLSPNNGYDMEMSKRNGGFRDEVDGNGSYLDDEDNKVVI
jgi:carboxypeptidase D